MTPQTPARPDPVEAGSWKADGPVSFRHGGREESPTSSGVAADSEGRAGLTPPGAVPFTLPPARGLPRFTNPPPPPPPPFPPPHPAPPPVLPALPTP
jgi:hypothetical protein